MPQAMGMPSDPARRRLHRGNGMGFLMVLAPEYPSEHQQACVCLRAPGTCGPAGSWPRR